MKKLKVTLSLFMVILILCVSIAPTFAVIAPEDSASSEINAVDKIDDKLKTVIEDSTSNDIIKVALWLSDVDEEERSQEVSSKIRLAEEKDELSTNIVYGDDFTISRNTELSSEDLSQQAQTLVEIKREVEKELHTENNTNVLNTLSSVYDIDSEPIFVSNYAPFIIMEMTKDEIADVANNQSIENIYLYEPAPIVEENDLVVTSTSGSRSLPYGVWQNITNINTLRDMIGLTGAGVKIGMLERDAANFDYNGINATNSQRLYEQFDYHLDNNLLHFSDTVSSNDAWHANYTLSIISGFTDDYEGVAPLAEIYCGGRSNGHYFEPIENMIENGVNVISGSVYWKWQDFSNDYDYVSKYVDYVVSNSKITLCFSAGNVDEDNPEDKLCSAPYAYNVIAIGNIDDKNTIDKSKHVISSGSLYNYVENEPYKPDICAPGSNTATYVVDNISNGGTSAACPVVAGVCALLMQAAPELKTDPMLVKSLLMSSAKELDSSTDIYSTATSVDPALTRECGPGMVNAYVAYTTYTSGNYRTYPSSYDTTINHAVNVSQKELTAGKDIYVALNWMQWNTVNGVNWNNESNYNVLNGYHHTLSLYDPNGVLVAVSNFQYDRKQFIRYKPLQTGRYTAKVTRSYTGLLQYYPQFAVAHCIK